MTEVFTFKKLGRCFAYTTDEETAVVGKTENDAIVAVLERDAVFVRRKHVPAKVKAAAAAAAEAQKLEGLTFRQAAEHATAGRKITRAGHERAWYITWLPNLAPHWAKIFLDATGKSLLPYAWPDKAPAHHSQTGHDLHANDWKVLPK